MNPLKNMPEIPMGYHPGAFGAPRKHDVHTGLDLYCEPGDEVFSIGSGEVVAIVDFTGEVAGTPWWNNTKAVIVQQEQIEGHILYGEIEPLVFVGQKLKNGDVIGKVVTVLKKDKGLPMTMLHLEYYNKYFDSKPVEWLIGGEIPNYLVSPYKLFTKNLHDENYQKIGFWDEKEEVVQWADEVCYINGKIEGFGSWRGADIESYGYYKNGLKEGMWRIKNIRENEVFYECEHVNDIQHGRTLNITQSSVIELKYCFCDTGLWSGEEIRIDYELDDDPNPGIK
jgi:hypothetical protein